jgi:membrane protein implicated in regulation of membrane protease activity
MEVITQLLFDVGPYHWLALAALLIAIEMIMPTQYLMWPGVAAAVVGLAGFVLDLPLAGEVALFAVMSAGLVVISNRFLPASTGPVAGSLNQRMDQLVGRPAVVLEDFQHGAGPVTIGDTRWSARVEGGGDLKAGTSVTVVSADSTLLTVKAG